MSRVFVAASSQSLNLASVLPYGGASVWFYCTDLSADRPILSVYANAANRQTLYLRASDSKLVYVSQVTTGSSEVVSTSTVSINAWHHAYAGAETSLVVGLDGVLVGGGTINTFSGTATRLARAYGVGNLVYFEGRLAEFTCWNADISTYGNSEMVQSLAKRANPLKIVKEQLILHMPMVANDVDYIGKLSWTTAGGPTYGDHVSTKSKRRSRIIVPRSFHPIRTPDMNLVVESPGVYAY